MRKPTAAPPDPVDWKKALKKLADYIDAEARSTQPEFCMYYCPASGMCQDDHNSDDHRCRRVLIRWARENF